MPTSPTKNFGSGVSGYLPPDHHAWESVVFRQAKPGIRLELDLLQDLQLNGVGGVQTALRRSMPSGWVAGDFLASGGPQAGWFQTSAVANQLSMTAPLTAFVNGWYVQVDYTGIDLTASPGATGNVVDMGTAPAGAGVKRQDLVVLEVWRKLIVAAPDTGGKSQGARIWRNGNVKIPAGSDVQLNYTDDIKDTNVGSETTRRVQIQYRLRVIQGVDLFAFPYGVDDTSVVAFSVPPNAATPDGTSTVFTYANQSANGDPGLWRAGNGIPSNTLGTVDGYMYCIPLCAVFRRNTTAFARLDNHNGGALSPAGSDRPDGLWTNIIDGADIADLRYGVSPQGWNYQEIGEKAFQSLLDNTLATDWGTTNVGGGTSGHTVLWGDEIGVSTANGGSAPDNGDTAGGEFVGEFDDVRRRFSERPIMETMTVRIPAGGAWTLNQVVTINFTSIRVYPYGPFNFAAFAPAATMALDITRARYVGDGTASHKNTDVIILDVSGLAQQPISSVTFKLGAIPSGVTTEDILVDVLMSYPPGEGLTKTATTTYGANSFSLNNPAALPVGAPVLFNGLVNPDIDIPHREAILQYHTVARTFDMPTDSSFGGVDPILPERAESVSAVLVDGVGAPGAFNLDTTGRILSFTAFVPTPGHKLTITYVALRPIPQTGAQYTIFYSAREPQTARTELLGTTFTGVPRWVSPYLYVLTVGPGSAGEAYPYPVGSTQTAVYPTSGGTFTGEHELNGSEDISLSEFSSSTGFLRVPAMIPYTPAPEHVTFTRNDPGDRDIEDRTFFKSVPGGQYVPNSYGSPLSDASRHKVLLPVLMELPADSTLGKQGQLVLVVLSRWAPFDTENGLAFNSDLSQNTTVASVYRIKGNLLNRSS